MSSKRVSFMDCGPSTSGDNSSMPQETALKLLDVGATLFLLDVPPKTEIGIDVHSWNTGEKFMGIKMIPPGIHFVYWSAVSSECQTGPRTGFFYNFRPKEIVAKKYIPENEEFSQSPVSAEELERLKSNLKTLDGHLGAYPYNDWKKWVSLTNKISVDTITRLNPLSGQIISVSDLIPESSTPNEGEEQVQKRFKTVQEWEESKLPKMSHRPGTEIRFTPLPTMKYPEGASPQEITKHSMDSTYQLEQLMIEFQRLYGDKVSSEMCDKDRNDEVLAELQFSFVCFLVGQHYDSFEHWKKLVTILCTCDEALIKFPKLYITLITDLHFQIREVPDDFFVDIVSSSNFLVTILTNFFSNIRSNSSAIDSELRLKAERFQAHLTHKFDWDFEIEELDEDQPVVVDIEDP